ncbi:hypothetical protein LZ32DRAFT_347767 [Colletotrichum eremochloae]|nr:hypothetical protein LZ32DRAFT_347767 [Colletotrichum eremochloae]
MGIFRTISRPLFIPPMSKDGGLKRKDTLFAVWLIVLMLLALLMTAVIRGHEKKRKKRSRGHTVSPIASILALQLLSLAAHRFGRPVASLVLLRRLPTTDIRRHKEPFFELAVNLEERCQKWIMLFGASLPDETARR